MDQYGDATIKGVEHLIEAVQTALHREPPIRAAEMFDKWHAATESIVSYIVRKHLVFDRLKKLSNTTKVSEVSKAHLLLKFSWL